MHLSDVLLESLALHHEGAINNMIRNKLDKLITSLSAKEQEATFLELRKIYGNIIQHPNDDKHRQIKLTDETFTSKVWQYPAGEELMKMSGRVLCIIF